MGGSPSKTSMEDPADAALAANYCDILGRGIDGFNIAGPTTDQMLLKARVAQLVQDRAPFDLGKGRHVSLPRNIKSMTGSVSTVRNKKAVKQEDDKSHDASALLGGQFHFVSLEGGGSYGASQYSYRTYMTTNEHGFRTEYRLYIAPDTDSSALYLDPKIEEQIPSDGNSKDMAKFLRKYGTHAVTGIEIGRWHDAFVMSESGGTGAHTTASAKAKVGAAAPSGHGLQAAATASRENGSATEQTNEQSVTHESGEGMQIMINTFTALHELVADEAKKRVLEDAIAQVSRAPGTAASGWDLESYLDFCGVRETSWAVPPTQDNQSATPVIKKFTPFSSKDKSVYINTNQVLVPTDAGVPTGLSLDAENDNQISVSVEHTQDMPCLFKHRGFNPAIGVWREPSGKNHVKRFRGHFKVDCRQVLPAHNDRGETGILTGLQLVFKDGMMSLRGHFSPLAQSKAKTAVWKGRDGVSMASEESLSSASTHGERTQTPPQDERLEAYVDTAEYSYGLKEKLSMMHWVLVGARLDVVKGDNLKDKHAKDKLSIRGKFALLAYH